MRLLPILLVVACASGVDPLDAPEAPSEHAQLVSATASTPDAPVVERTIAAIQGNAFTGPHLPPHRTSADGRFALNNKNDGGFAFFLLAPEKLSGPFRDGPAGAEILASTTPITLPDSDFYDTSLPRAAEPRHRTICDATPDFGTDLHANPYACGADDCYDVTIVTSVPITVQGANHQRLWSRTVTARVSQPKTAAAQLVSVTPTGSPRMGPSFEANSFFEPLVTRDGHLLSVRVGSNQFPWTNPNTGAVQNQRADLVYAVAPEGAEPCDVAEWSDFHPMSHAPFDPEVNTRYGFAAHPFRAPDGALIPDGHDLEVTYPWIDPDGKNVFFTATGEQVRGRYAESHLPNGTCAQGSTQAQCLDPGDSGGITRGHGMAGLWTHGKMVVFDNDLNSTDFGHRANNEAHRMLDLYTPGTGPLGTESGAIRVGAGRDNTIQAGGGVRNTTFFDSTTHRHHALDAMLPVTPRDVVWLSSNGKSTVEIAFDDWVDPDVFLDVPMMPAHSFVFGASRMAYHDGWDGTALAETMRLANQATPTSDRWVVPDMGLVFGGTRVESIGMGGISGRGLWLDGSSGVHFDVPEQPTDPTTRDWFVGVFVDPRFADDGAERALLRFPDGSEVRLEGHGAVVLRSADAEAHVAHLPYDLADTAWSHLGLRVLDGGTRVVLYLDGYRFSEWTSPDGTTLLQLVSDTLPGALVLGGDTPRGLRGWVDELELLAHDLSAEEVCNHALGTLVGLESGATMWAEAGRFPQRSHDAISDALAARGQATSTRYACLHDYTADGTGDLSDIPTDAVRVRESLLFPEGPIFHDAPRPDSSGNAFCLSCHVDGAEGGLTVDALTADPAPAVDDLRRQPSQPPRKVYGHIPADWLAPGVPPAALVAPAQGLLLDTLSQDAVAGSAPVVEGITLHVDGRTDALTSGAVYERLAWQGSATATVSLDVPSVGLTATLDGQSLTVRDRRLTLGVLGVGRHTLTLAPAGGTAHVVEFDVVDSTAATIVASYRDDFGATPPLGWQYLWNAHGPMGDPSAYQAMAWTGRNYDSDGATGLPDASALGWGRFEAAGGAAGYGAAQAASAGLDRFVVAAWTVQQTGAYDLVDTELVTSHANCDSDGIALQVWVDDELRDQQLAADAVLVDFDQALGVLFPGQTIYVGVGPDGNMGCDRFSLDFSVQRQALVDVAGWRADWATPELAEGWRLLWNAHGAMGAPDTRYANLRYDGVSRYDGDGRRGLPDAGEIHWGRLERNGGLTGRGASSGGTEDRHVIAAYRVPHRGHYAITDSWIEHQRTNCTLTGGRVDVYAGGVFRGSAPYATGGRTDFDLDLGVLDAGDEIWVAPGPDGDDGCDRFLWDYTLSAVPVTVLADYRDDFGAVPANGWTYRWGRPDEPVSAWLPLYWDGANTFDSDGVSGLPDTSDLAWGGLLRDGGRTAYGPVQGQTDPPAAFAGWTGAREVRVVGEVWNTRTCDPDGAELIVRTDAAVLHRQTFDPGERLAFSVPASLGVGESVHVGVGPRDTSSCGRFAWEVRVLGR
jgi:hypothetical protein